MYLGVIVILGSVFREPVFILGLVWGSIFTLGSGRRTVVILGSGLKVSQSSEFISGLWSVA